MFAFETERLRVRDLLVTDKENFFLLNGSEEVMRYIRPVKTREESDHQLEQILALGPSVPHNGRWAVEEKISGMRILEEEIIETIVFLESTGRKIRHEGKNTSSGYKEIGYMTYWVEYAPVGNAFAVYNAYSHRMEIVEGDQR